MSFGYQAIKTLGNTGPCTQKIIESRPGSDISLGFLTISLCFGDDLLEKTVCAGRPPISNTFPLWKRGFECNHSVHTDEELRLSHYQRPPTVCTAPQAAL